MLTTLVLIFIADIFTLNYISQLLKSILPRIIFTTIKYLGIVSLFFFIVIFTRIFFFDIYFVPSKSMERTLFAYDYILVNKFLYGVKLQNYSNDMSLVSSIFSKKATKENYSFYRQLRGFKKFSREDIVVFKTTENSNGFYVKRIIGLPGDTLQIKNTVVYVNNNIQPQRDDYCYSYILKNNNKFDLIKSISNEEYNKINNKKKSKLVKLVDSVSSKYIIFPNSKQSEWTRDNYGKIIVPKKGKRILLTKENYDIYKSIIEKYEQATFKIKNGDQSVYIFKNDYYFMLGDNRHNSLDSRSYGFVPENYIQGKMIFKI